MQTRDLLEQLAALAREEQEPSQESLPPLDEAARTRITAQLLEEFKPSKSASILPFRSWRSPLLSLAAAAVLIFLVLPRGFEPLPSYELSVEGGAQSQRSAIHTLGPRRLGPGDRLELLLRPEQSCEGLEAQAFIQAKGKEIRPLSPPEMSPQGVVRLLGSFESLTLDQSPPGPAEIILLLAHPGAMPEPLPEKGEGAGWRRFSISVQLLPH